jgi:hypothetical protein
MEILLPIGNTMTGSNSLCNFRVQPKPNREMPNKLLKHNRFYYYENMLEQNDNLIEEVLKLIPPSLFPKDRPISGRLRLETDLGIYGDDAVDFLAKFGEKYNVDLSNLDYSKYFTKEISFYFIRRFFLKRNKLDLTIDDLVSSINTGKLE